MIARELGIQTGTVNSYWVRIRGKLGNLSRSELVGQFVQRNADAQHAEYVAQSGAEAAKLADVNREILAKADAEIEHLKQLLSESKNAPS